MNRKKLEEIGIRNVDFSLSWLLSLYYGVEFGTPDDEDLALLREKVLTSDGNKVIIDLFSECGEGCVEDRIDEYLDIFKSVGKKGSRKDCIKRINKFLKENKKVTFDKILEAAEYHISTDDYPRKPHYFIHKDRGVNRISSLEECLENMEDDYSLFKSV